MREIDAHFDAYEHMKHMPREQDALHMLRKAASAVKPLMRKRGWKVGTLAEFLPDEPQLLGLNINRTERILIRLRYHHDSRQFLSMEQITDTLLHELSHIVWGPHDHNFNNLWNELRDEHQTLLAKGFTGEGFMGSGNKLGGRRIPLDEMRRQARLAAEKRSAGANRGSGGNRVGGRQVARGVDIRKVIADAATRRTSITEGCASGSQQAGKLNSVAVQDGYRTKAEEDDANDAAIARALQELMEEEEMAKLGAPTGAGGLAWDPENGLSFDNDPVPQSKSPAASKSADRIRDATSSAPPSLRNRARQPTRNQNQPTSRLVTDYEARNAARRSTTIASSQRPQSRLISREEEIVRNKALPPTPRPQTEDTASTTTPSTSISQTDIVPRSSDPTKWVCPQCTLLNPLNYLLCDACGLEQPPQPIPLHQRFGPSRHASNLPKPPPQSDLRGPGATPFEPAKGRIGWNCLQCGTFMENEWWTCSLCGTMKDSS